MPPFGCRRHHSDAPRATGVCVQEYWRVISGARSALEDPRISRTHTPGAARRPYETCKAFLAADADARYALLGRAARGGVGGSARISPRNAAFTARAVGNAAATSGARTTTFVPCAYRFAYLPRTPPLKSYSARMGLSRTWPVGFFISAPLAAAGLACTDEADVRLTLLRMVWVRRGVLAQGRRVSRKSVIVSLQLPAETRTDRAGIHSSEQGSGPRATGVCVREYWGVTNGARSAEATMQVELAQMDNLPPGSVILSAVEADGLEPLREALLAARRGRGPMPSTYSRPWRQICIRHSKLGRCSRS